MSLLLDRITAMRSTTTAYCYTRSVVGVFVCVCASVCLSFVSSAKSHWRAWITHKLRQRFMAKYVQS